MKKAIIGALVGACILFVWQFLSFALINFHEPMQGYTDKDKTILAFIQSQGLKEGGYILPGLPEGATRDDHEKAMTDNLGKPWASLQYHEKLENDMVMNMVRGFLSNFVVVLLFCWIARRLNPYSFSTIFTASLVTGLIIFLYAHYTHHIWYETFDMWGHFLDAIVSWGLLGLWLAWWLRRGRDVRADTTVHRTV